MLRFAERSFLGVLFVALKARLRHDDPPRTTRRQGAVKASGLAGSNLPRSKIAWRKRHVLAFSA